MCSPLRLFACGPGQIGHSLAYSLPVPLALNERKTVPYPWKRIISFLYCLLRHESCFIQARRR